MAISRTNTFESYASPASTAEVRSSLLGTTKDKRDIKDKEQRSTKGVQLSEAARDLYKVLTKHKDSNDLDGLVGDLFPLMIGQYTRVKKKEVEMADIMLFLLDNNDKNISGAYPGAQYVDHCIRWCILNRALEPRSAEPQDACNAIAEWIVKKWPMLVFRDPQSEKNLAGPNYSETGTDQFSFKARCKCKHNHKIEHHSTPYHRAAKAGNYEVIKFMVNSTRLAFDNPSAQPDPPIPEEETLCSILLSEEPESGRSETALQLALYAKRGSLETLEELLEAIGPEAPAKDFEEAVNDEFDLAVEAFLRTGLELEADVFRKLITTALNNLDKKRPRRRDIRSVQTSDVRICRLNIIKSLVRRATTADKFTEEVAEAIIKNDLQEVWDAKNQAVPDQSVSLRLLHMAVRHERPGFVERFVEDYPKSLEAQEKVPNDSDDDKQYPLWYNNRKWNPKTKKYDRRQLLVNGEVDSPQTRIRRAIITKMIHRLDIDKLSDILHRSQGM